MKKRIQVLQDCRRAGLTRLFSINTYLRLKRKREERQRSKTVLDEVLGQIKVSIFWYNLNSFRKFLILPVYVIFNASLCTFLYILCCWLTISIIFFEEKLSVVICFGNLFVSDHFIDYQALLLLINFSLNVMILYKK